MFRMRLDYPDLTFAVDWTLKTNDLFFAATGCSVRGAEWEPRLVARKWSDAGPKTAPSASSRNCTWTRRETAGRVANTLTRSPTSSTPWRSTTGRWAESNSNSNNFIIPQEIHMWYITLKTENRKTHYKTLRDKSINRYKRQ